MIKQWSGNQNKRECFALKRFAVSSRRGRRRLPSETGRGFPFPCRVTDLVSSFSSPGFSSIQQQSARRPGLKRNWSTFGHFCFTQYSNSDFKEKLRWENQPSTLCLEGPSVLGCDRNTLSEVNLTQEPSKKRLLSGSEFWKQPLK